MEVNFLKFCEKGNLIAVKKCLDEGVNSNFQNNEGESPLQVAAANGYLDLVTLLLKSGASVDLPNNYGWTPLMHAAKYGHTSVVAHLIKSKAKVNITNKLGISAVLAAAYSGNLATVKLLIEAGAMVQHMSAGNETNESDLSTVMAVSFFGYSPVLKYLVQNGGIIHHSSPVTGLTPLMLAVCAGHNKIAHFLVENGADFNAMDICGRTALDYAHIFNQLEIRISLENQITSKPSSFSNKIDVFKVIKDGDVLKIKSVLERDPPLVNSSQSPSGITPLMVASVLGLYDVANILISHGASLHIQDTEKGWTALTHAVFNGHFEIVKLLLDAGANVNICATNGCTALDLAKQNVSCPSTIIDMLSAKYMLEMKSTLLTPEITKRGRSSASERSSSKRNLSQTRMKEWIGGMAQHLQNKMLTLRSPKYSENASSTNITTSDESSNEVFLEQTSQPEELDKETSNSSIILSPDVYLADVLKEHKVEAIIPPFPPISTDFVMSMKESYKRSSDKNKKHQKNSLRVPNLLKSYYRKKQSVGCNVETNEKVITPHEKSLTKENETCSSLNSQCENLTLSSNTVVEQTETLLIDNKLSAGDLALFLNEESLQKYTETFRNQEIDMETFLHLTPSDLYEIGIKNTESQKKLMDLIKKLQNSK
ncbi:ankyrin repeat and SAM domain-containing protein 6 [Parasteatoda tepidariorum]|uniref:ankyrin repeat and SAM domain-containing protein 6 n=1 Tax=Parasteatoda tepidariorum TaxID=114398 RepID=UPI001C7292D2|nr:ankyrin repeat and SAM domain-containing protein 6 [Parasteatoda tepidariorum]